MPVGIGEDAWSSEKCMQEEARRLGLNSWFLLLTGYGTLGKLGFLFSGNEATKENPHLQKQHILH